MNDIYGIYVTLSVHTRLATFTILKYYESYDNFICICQYTSSTPAILVPLVVEYDMFGDIGRSFISWLGNKDGGSIYSYSFSGMVSCSVET